MSFDGEPSDGGACRFHSYRFDLDSGELTRGGRRVRLRPKASRVLARLLRTPGSLVTHEQLVRAAWGDVRVDVDSSLHNVISELREALGDEASRPRYVETVHRRGYCFIAPVEHERPDPAAAAAGAERGDGGRRRDGLDGRHPAAGGGGTRSVHLGVGILVLVAAMLLVAGLIREPEGVAGSEEPASDANLRGRYLVEHGRPDEVRQGRALLRDAVAGDAADSARAWGSLATAEVALWNLEDAAVAARRALELDPESADAFRVLGQLAVYVDRDWTAAEHHLLQSLDLDPDVATTHVAYSTLLLVLGREDDALREARLARSLAPLSPAVNGELARLLAMVGQYEDAAAQAHRTLELDPEHADAYAVLHTAHRARDELPQAREALVESLARRGAPEALLADMRTGRPREGLRRGYEWFAEHRLAPAGAGMPNRHYLAALAYLFLGQEDLAWLHLQTARERNEPLLPLAAADPRFAPLRERPGFGALLADLGLTDRH